MHAGTLRRVRVPLTVARASRCLPVVRGLHGASVCAARVHAQHAPTPPELDWTQDVADDQLDTTPTDEQFASERAFWEAMSSGRSEEAVTRAVQGAASVPGEQPHEQLKAIPLTGGRRREVDALELSRLLDIFRAQLRVGALSGVWRTFLETRREGHLPPLEMYEHVASLLSAWSAQEALTMLEAEMVAQGLPRTERVLAALLDAAVVRQDRARLEALWAEAHHAKLDLPDQIYAHTLLFYTRNVGDLGASQRWYAEMERRGKAGDCTGATLLLDLARVHKLPALARDLFARLQTRGMLTPEATPEHATTVEGQRVVLRPAARQAALVHTLMAEIEADAQEVQAARTHLHLAHTLDAHFVATPAPRPGAPSTAPAPARVWEKLAWVHLGRGEVGDVRALLEDMVRASSRPPQDLYRALLLRVLDAEPPAPALFQEVRADYDLWGLPWDAELYAAQMRMWFRLGDDRRVLNLWHELLALGHAPTAEVRAQYLEVLARSGRDDDLQRVYEQQLAAGHALPRRAHALMLLDFLKRGYPSSARQVAQRMARQGVPATQAELLAIAQAYATRGGGQQVLALMEQDASGPQARYALDAPLLGAALEGLATATSPSPSLPHPALSVSQAARLARDAWARYGPQVALTPPAATQALTALGRLGLGAEAAQVFVRAQVEALPSATPTEAHALFLAWAQVPLSPSAPLAERVSLLGLIEGRDLVVRAEVWRALLLHAQEAAAPLVALELMQRFVRTHYGVPLQRSLALLFFGALARHDASRLRREAHVWLDRLLPPARNTNPWLPSARTADQSLESVGEELLSVVQSLEVAKYVANLTPDLLVPTTLPTLEDLRTPSLIDVEDQLVAQGHAPQQVASVLEGVDEDARRLHAALTALSPK